MAAEIKRTVPQNQEDVIDLVRLLEDGLKFLKKYFLQLLLLFLSATCIVTAYYNYSYMPSYKAKIIYAVNRSGDSGIDSYLANRICASVSTLCSLNEFHQELLEEVDPDTINYSYWFSSMYTEESNLFTVNIRSNNYENTNYILKRFREIFPSWAYTANGMVDLEEVDVTESSRIPVNEYALWRSILKGMLVGAALCIGLAVLYGMLLKTVRQESDMKTITGKNCMAQVPEIKIKKRGKKSSRQLLLLTNKHVDWRYREALQTIQTRAFQMLGKNDEKILMISSTVPQEGKTSVAVNIALACVSQGKKTILLDADLRNPSVLKAFRFKQVTVGMVDYLRGTADLSEVIVSNKNFSLITAGSEKRGLSAVINEERMKDLFDYLRRSYDCIIVDTPPSALFSDAALMSDYVDGVIYVVRNNIPTIEQVKEGITPFIQNEKLLGYVFNRTVESILSYGKYGGYGYSKSYRYGSYGYSKYQRYVPKEKNLEVDIEKTEMNTEDSL